jgi:hypothetical protein
MTSNNKQADSSIPGGTGGTANPKSETTASAKAIAGKKNQQQQQKNQKANPPSVKKKQTQVVRSNFKGTASITSPMEGVSTGNY